MSFSIFSVLTFARLNFLILHLYKDVAKLIVLVVMR